MSKKLQMKIIDKQEGDTIRYYYLCIELSDGREVEANVMQTYNINPDFLDTFIEIINEKDFTKDEIKQIKTFIEKNY